ncbi:MAG: TetR family transcriptional regulator, partial [Bdellovibrionales bacterium]
MSKRENVREKILKTAVALLGECGIRKLAQPQIAKSAGVPQGHMTYYFPTRSHLLIAVA